MTRRGLWVSRAVYTLIYLGVAAGWWWWLDLIAPDASWWQRLVLLVWAGVVFFWAGEVRAVWRDKPNPNAKTWAQRREAGP